MMTVKWLLSVWLVNASFLIFWKEINHRIFQHEAQGHKEVIHSEVVEDADVVVDEAVVDPEADMVDPEVDTVQDEEDGTD